MARSRKSRHTGVTQSGSTKEVIVERIGRVTIYQRGRFYYVYYSEKGRRIRRKVDGNLATACAVASRISASLEEGSPSTFGYTRISVDELVRRFLEYCEDVQGLALRTVDRYRAGLSHLREFADCHFATAMTDQVTETTVEDFVSWLKRQPRTRNGAQSGKRANYTRSGVKFILNTCRTTFNWAAKRKYLPPYAENPFSSFPIDRVFRNERSAVRLFTEDERKEFFEACDRWQRPIFLVLAAYGLRVGELTHLLVSDMCREEGHFAIRSKPELFWSVKTRCERVLPTLPDLSELFERLIDGRREGFLFLNKEFAAGGRRPSERFDSKEAFLERLRGIADGARDAGAETREVKRKVTAFLRTLGQIPEKRVRQEFMKVSKRIGCAEVTRVHSLRHLFSTRAQAKGLNPLLVQGILGHATLEMTSNYTHFTSETKRSALSALLNDDPALREFT